MKRWVVFLALVLSLFADIDAASPTYYDQEESDRRAAERLNRYMREQRDAARRRGDEEELRQWRESRSGSSADDLIGSIGLIGLSGVLIFFTLVRPILTSIKGEDQGSLKVQSLNNGESAAPPSPVDVSDSRAKKHLIDPPAEPARARFTRVEIIQKAGNTLVEVVNLALHSGAIPSRIEGFCRDRWSLLFSINNGQLTVSEEQLLKIYPIVSEVAKAFKLDGEFWRQERDSQAADHPPT